MSQSTPNHWRYGIPLAAVIMLACAALAGFDPSQFWLPVVATLITFLGTALFAGHNRGNSSTSDQLQTQGDSQLVSKLSASAGGNAIASAEVSFSIDSLTKTLEKQVEEITQIQQNATAITETVQIAATSAQTAEQSSSEARQISESGRVSLQQAITEMREINERTGSTLKQIENLDQKIHKIQDVTKVIEEIASQTNLLALNAAIEAARAGEHGRGFAVVADEVRQLAARTADSTNEVGQIVEDILGETKRVVSHIQTLSQDVDQGTIKVAEVGEQLEGIADQSRTVEEQISAIAEGTESSRTNLDQILGAITRVQTELSDSEQEMEHLATQATRLMEMAETSNALLAESSNDNYHGQYFILADEMKRDIEEAFEKAISQRLLTESDLFDRNYQPIQGTNPQKFSTRYDKVCDKILPSIQEPVLQKDPRIIYAIANDDKGYVPTHNTCFSKPLTGDYQTDFAGNRTKRLFNDRTGARCGSHTKRMLVQTYKRDTGEIMHDLSVPIYVRGKHWGSIRMGYRPDS